MSQALIVVGILWTRLIPAFCFCGLSEERITPVPDNGLRIELAGSEFIAIPAHFLHAPGNFHLFDSISKILFTGDLRVSVAPTREAINIAEEFREHLLQLAGFHNRYIASKKACIAWVHPVRDLDIEMIVPQHGFRFVGKEIVSMFLDWATTENTALDDFCEQLFALSE